uniref:Calmodulin n=1 Tax=Spumella elongata TaxID=89044 RepID=A0A7S3HF70_9STRA|mmetsp:Transcript_49660/g.86758  ORF Transcript_49660/g.86758 Transcript_49660/m.86758 type:complete len:536 (+) Transcript_49660:120-1727(+)|eukprot:CAMPEP_0184989248 /NCGR_PEP_ID=MMETSP1098-20130426/27528_1 /TAXON_ID=89044 /ORGANISM="Spumella elongata, Strain CCAP 955/1" /LENGTH=535 /DNA_ID=CAMNT_0027514211 /DNA_START=121 /DNA_END=1728 /DNA_ORIENTATION=+
MASFEKDAATMRVIAELKRLYKTKILPLEQLYKFDVFNSPHLTDAEFDSKPQVMLLGQYSVGKTTFIRYLLGQDFPGQRIGPEPTTDRFTAIIDGPDERVIPGNALAVSHDMPYRGLERFGVAFLNRFEGAQLPNQVLKNITLIDTPGVLSGEKQRVARGYDFCQVCTWFAGRADLIILLFDAHKLDISDEFRNAIDSLKGNDDKIRCILNKADQVDRQKLMRVYGALMWSLGKVIKSPEVLRVYIGSFWDQPLMYEDNAQLFEMEEKDLMRDLKDLPRNSAVRKINELVKRVRLAKVHAYIIGHLKEQMPVMMGHAKKQAQLIETLPTVFRSVMKKYNLAPGDFPDIAEFQKSLAEFDFSKFQVIKQKYIDDAEHVMSTEFPRLMEALPRSLDSYATGGPPVPSGHLPIVYDVKPTPAFAVAEDDANPWGDDAADPVAAKVSGWALSEYVSQYKPQFDSIAKNGLVTGGAAKKVLGASGLPVANLRDIWNLADVDSDGNLDLHEFVIAMFLIDMVKQGHAVPAALDPEMVPPGK